MFLVKQINNKTGTLVDANIEQQINVKTTKQPTCFDLDVCLQTSGQNKLDVSDQRTN